MRKLNRRKFLGTGVAGALAASVISGCTEDNDLQSAAAAPIGGKLFDWPIGFQSYGMRKEIEKDFTGTLASVKALGYDCMEMCSPLSYQKAGFGNLTAIPPAEIKRQIADTGLVCESAHFQSHEVLKDDPAKTADYAAAMGLKYVIMSGSGIGDDGTPDDFMRWGEKCNKAGAIVKAAGLKLGYHNHQVGPQVEGRAQFEYIMEALDPEMVAMQFQLASVRGGYDVVYWIEKYAGRYTHLHMHDFDPALIDPEKPGRQGGIVPLGEGMIDWAAVVKASLKSPMAKYGFIVEIETEEPLEGLRRSINYLKTVSV